MKKSVLFALITILTTMTFTQCLLADTVDIPVVMDIAPIASIVLNGAQIKLLPVPGSMDYEGSTSSPIITCNVEVAVTATTVGEDPLVTTDWQTKLQGQGYNGTPTSDPYIVSPLATPLNLGVAVLAQDVDMTVRADGTNARVATTTVTVVPN